MRSFFLSIIFLLLIELSYSQHISFEIQTGIGFYGMNDIKQVNNSILSSFNSETKTRTDFPPFQYYQPSVSLKTQNISLNFGYFKEFEKKDFNIQSVRRDLINVENDILKTNGLDALRIGLSFSYLL